MTCQEAEAAVAFEQGFPPWYWWRDFLDNAAHGDLSDPRLLVAAIDLATTAAHAASGRR